MKSETGHLKIGLCDECKDDTPRKRLVPRELKIELDGEDISSRVSRIELVVDAQQCVHANVTFFVTNVEVDAPGVLVESKEEIVEAQSIGSVFREVVHL